MKFKISLPIPPSVNRMYRGGGYKARGRRFKAQNYINWLDKCEEVMRSYKPLPAFNQRAKIEYAFYYKDKRAGDNQNYLKALTDYIVKKEILKDDRHNILIEEKVYFAGYDKGNPRVEVTIRGVE